MPLISGNGRWLFDDAGLHGSGTAAGAFADFVGEGVAGFGPVDALPDGFHVDIELRPVRAAYEAEPAGVVPVFKYAFFAGHLN